MAENRPGVAQFGEAERPLIQEFVDAYQALRATALADPGHAQAEADDGKHLVARFSTETHDISFGVPSANVIAGRGLRAALAWWRRRQLNRPPSHFNVDVSPADEPPVSVQFSCVRSGRDMLDPTIRGYDATRTYIDSQFRLLDHTQSVIDTANNPSATIISFEQPGQNQPQSLFVGDERTKFTALLKPMLEKFPVADTPPDRIPPEVIAVKDLALNDTHDITFQVSSWGTGVRIVPRAGYEGDLPPITIDYTGREKAGEKPLYIFHTPDRHHLNLSRKQREELLGILAEEFRPDKFSRLISEEELLRPDDELLAACARLIPEGQDFAGIPFQDDETGEPSKLNIAVSETGTYTVNIQLEREFIVISFDQEGLNMRGGLISKDIDEATILKIYRIILELGAPPKPNTE